MHMSDALLSPTVGVALLATSAGIGVYSIYKLKHEIDDRKIPLMGVMGALIFAAQMINFTIPGTGSSGHLGGGLLLAALLGPYAGFITLASVLIIQALFFADGGLLAIGANVFNLGFYTCFLVYPLIMKPLLQNGVSKRRILIGSMIGAVIGLQFGALSVVLETLFSGKTELPLIQFLTLMQPIHLAIGIIEGLVTASVLIFVYEARPETFNLNKSKENHFSFKALLLSLVVVASLVGGVVSLYASEKPDGLEWSIKNIAGTDELQGHGALYNKLAEIQEKISFLPDYGKKNPKTIADEKIGTSASGLIGGGITLLFVVIFGYVLTTIKKKTRLQNSK